MRFPQPLSACLPALLIFLTAGTGLSRAQSVRIVGSDSRGITLRVDVSAFDLRPPGDDGRSRLLVADLGVANLPGRPELPFASALIAIPPGARPVARVIDGAEELREGVRLTIARQPGFQDDGGAMGAIPTLERVKPITDGVWPRSAVEVDEPFSIRRQRVATVRLQPFRYEEETGRLWIRRSLTVRLDWSGATFSTTAPSEPPDGHWEPVLKSAILNYEDSRAWREPKRRDGIAAESLFGNRPGPGISAPAAFDENDAEVRVRIDTTGVHSLEFDVLQSNGYPTGVPIAQVSVHRHEYVQNATPSYVTIELPIEVVDADANGVFGSGDRILVFVQNWAERSRASVAQRVWGDAEVIYVTRLTSRNGLRLPTRSGWNDLALTPLPAYPYTQRWEKNQVYLPVIQNLPAVSDTNTDQFLWNPGGVLVELFALPDSFRFETNQIDTTHQVAFSVTWQGTKANAHYQWAHLRNGRSQITGLADSLPWLGRGAFTRTFTLNGSALSEGNTNVFRSWGKNQLCSDPSNVECQRVNSVVNYFQATYWRSFRALNGYLTSNSAGVVGAFEVRARGYFTPDIRVYDVTDSLNPVRLALADSLIVDEGGTFAVRYQDTAGPGAMRSYIAFDQVRPVPFDAYSAVEREHLSDGTPADYLMIAPPEFKAATEPLAALRESQGHRVKLATLDAVNDEFNGGRRSSYAIKRFIRHAYRNWDAEFVLLVGDGSEDPQNFLGTAGKDWIPAQKVAGPVSLYDGSSNTFEVIVSDGWYGWCVDCPDPSIQPKIHDVFLGRLPGNSVQQITDMVNKILTYEHIDPSETWRRNMLILADDDHSTGTLGVGDGEARDCVRDYERVFRDISVVCRNLILNEARLARSNPELFDLKAELADEEPDPTDSTCYSSWSAVQQHTHLAITPKLIGKLNEGRVWWNFQGHANPSVLTHEDLYVNRGSNDDKDSFRNDDRPFLFSAFSCHPNTFGRVNELDAGPSLGEDMVALPRRGAIASWGSTGFEVVPNNAATHLNVHFTRALFADTSFGWNGKVELGQAVATALIANRQYTNSSFELDVGISYVLLGDPATHISVGPSQFVVTANGVPVEDAEPVRLYTFGDTLRIEADIASNTRIQSIAVEQTDALGTHIIPPADYTITPAFPDTLRGGKGGRFYHLSFRTTLGAGSFQYTIRTVDANGVAGKFDIVFRFLTVLRADGVPIDDHDAVPPAANLSLLVVSPGPITDPATDFVLTLNGINQPFTATPARGDTSRREWVLDWTHPPYAEGEYRLEFSLAGTDISFEHVFRVDGSTRIENAMAFPNPFEDDLGTHFSFNLVGEGPTNVQVRVYTVSGRLIYERSESGLLPGYHQLAWNARDAEQDKLANGVYVYRLLARGAGGSAMHEGRLVKLRKPIRKTIE